VTRELAQRLRGGENEHRHRASDSIHDSRPKIYRRKTGYFRSGLDFGEGQEMTRHEKEAFEGQHVVLDEGVFIECSFKNCSLEYSGGDTYVQNCRGENCQLVWRGAAQRTVSLLQGLGLIAQAPVTMVEPPTGRVQ
jgi:hypothetical protein